MNPVQGCIAGGRSDPMVMAGAGASWVVSGETTTYLLLTDSRVGP